MNDIKISELEETKYLQGGCCFPLVQENETKKVSFETLKNELPQTEVMVGDTKTGEPGTDAKVLNTGTPTNPLLNFTIPRGDKGEQGIQGPVGPKGPKGDTGNDVYVGNKSTAPEEAVLIIEPINGTASGNNIKLTDSANDKVVKITIDGKSVQNTYTGKNLFNMATIEKGRIDDGNVGYADGTSDLSVDGTTVSVTTTGNYRGFVSYYIPVKPSSKYTISFIVSNAATGFTCDEYNSSKVYTQRLQAVNVQTGTTKVINVTTTSSGGYIRLTFLLNSASTITFSNIQVELGASKTDYEPYVGGQASPNPDYPQNISTIANFITLKIQDNTKLLSNEVYYLFNGYELCSIGDVKDELKHTENGIQIIQRIGAVMLTGDETITRNVTYNNHYRYTLRSANDYKPVKNTATKPNIMSDRFVALAPDNTWGSANVAKLTGISVNTNNAQGYWFISYEDESVDTIEKFKAWLKANPVLVYYELAEPVTIDIELVDLPKTYDEISNITNTKNTNMNIEYATNKSNMYYKHNGNITKMKF